MTAATGGCLHVITAARLGLVESGGADGTGGGLEDSKLMMRNDLGIGETLAPAAWAEVRGTHDLLGHHEIILLL